MQTDLFQERSVTQGIPLSKPVIEILKIAGTIASHLVSSHLVMDVATQYQLNYNDYSLLCKCLFRKPMTEQCYINHCKERDELQLSEIL